MSENKPSSTFKSKLIVILLIISVAFNIIFMLNSCIIGYACCPHCKQLPIEKFICVKCNLKYYFLKK
jgi:ABC-type thiamin/hydroxymethylpyrimidine transport system permease subunit